MSGRVGSCHRGQKTKALPSLYGAFECRELEISGRHDFAVAILRLVFATETEKTYPNLLDRRKKP